jgi:peroxiredoxin
MFGPGNMIRNSAKSPGIFGLRMFIGLHEIVGPCAFVRLREFVGLSMFIGLSTFMGLCILLTTCSTLRASASEQSSKQSSDQSSLLDKLQGKQFLDTAGQAHSAMDWKDKRAMVFVFLAIDCPISNRYSPELNSIYSEFSKQGIAFYGVHSDATVTLEQARTHAAEYSLQFPVLLDSSLDLAKILGAKITPEAIVLSGTGVPLYRGRIDNLYITFGQMRAQPTVNDLRAVLENSVSGKFSAYKSNTPVGCYIPFSR